MFPARTSRLGKQTKCETWRDQFQEIWKTYFADLKHMLIVVCPHTDKRKVFRIRRTPWQGHLIYNIYIYNNSHLPPQILLRSNMTTQFDKIDGSFIQPCFAEKDSQKNFATIPDPHRVWSLPVKLQNAFHSLISFSFDADFRSLELCRTFEKGQIQTITFESDIVKAFRAKDWISLIYQICSNSIKICASRHLQLQGHERDLRGALIVLQARIEDVGSWKRRPWVPYRVPHTNNWNIAIATTHTNLSQSRRYNETLTWHCSDEIQF